MALDLHFQEQIAEIDFDKLGDEHKDNLYGGFDCNICLDVVHDPVVTFCGHLYCWPCIYNWIQFQRTSSENPDYQKPQCPVCKAEVSQKTLIPLYGPGQATKPSEGNVPSKGMVIPQRPRCGDRTLMATTNSLPSHQLHHLHQSQSHQPHTGGYMAASSMLNLGGTTTDMLHPMLGELVYAPVFRNTYPNSYNLAGNTSLRTRRQLLHADRSLGRLYLFFFCCVLASLLLF
ncbi:unnamed protein product [Withania somnifera]